jgi:lysophospholipase L1-like esterase
MFYNYLQKIRETITKDDIYKIIFYGDSITSTEWVHPNWREIIDYVLKDYLVPIIGDWKIPSWKIRTINAGLDGATTKDFVEQLELHVLSYNPSLVIFMGGKNDLYLGLSVEEYCQNLSEIFKKLNNKKIDTVFCSSTPSLRKDFTERFKPYVEKTPGITKKYNIPFINIFEQYQEFQLEKFFTFISEGNPEVGIKKGEIDPLHPNQLGNAYIAKILLKEIFGIDFDPEIYIKDTINGKMYPRYYEKNN